MTTTDPPASSPWRKVRIALLLVVLAGAGLKYLQVRRAERWVPDWRATQQVLLVLLAPASATPDEQAELERLTRFARLGDDKATLSALEHWFEVELGRYVDRPGFKPVQLRVTGPHAYSGAPPPPPRVGEGLSFRDRYRRTRDFLGWYEERLKDVPGRFPNIVFVTFYGADAAHVFRGVHSVASRRERRGFVFAPLTDQGRDAALINVAHELLHLFGATDKYEGERCAYPQGWVEPFKEPRLPQRFAEVMAQGIPVADGRAEASLDLFEAMRVGVETAREIGWIDEARRDRYYAGDVSAGPRLD
ncbi:MAG: hypothetical protein M9894_36620 [Planctomycetes bacterium]|nr:hypothetical protein [Planctomycetota bacterium]